MKRTPSQEAVLKTIVYSSIFSYPLTFSEIHTRLIGSSPDELYAQAVQEVVHAKILTKKGKYYMLHGEESLKELRGKREAWSAKLWKEVPHIQETLAKIPFIEAVYITGALAVNNAASEQDDIDICIVTQPDRLWIVRAIVITITSLMGKYRLHNYHGKGGWCFNLWVTTQSVTVPLQRRSLYTAYEVLQAKLIMGKDNVVLSSNAWIKQFLPNAPVVHSPTFHPVSTTLLTKPLKLINTWMYQLQMLYMKKRKTIEQVTQEFAYFHPRDTTSLIKNSYHKKLTTLGISHHAFHDSTPHSAAD